jgi:DNA gyrase subunit A
MNDEHETPTPDITPQDPHEEIVDAEITEEGGMPEEHETELVEAPAQALALTEPQHVEGVGMVQSRDLIKEMQTSYLDYAMSVIVARALPDARDGLKPVARRIFHVMNEMGLRHNVKHTKSAQIVGRTMGEYHPHGDQAIYDTMVRMAQPFTMSGLLVDGQGNFGSMDGDSAAAYRYTEARLTKLASELLADIDKDTVDFVPTYDGKFHEPTVLPTRFPNLLLNGSVGIAVGMATNIPPHNLGELCDATVAIIDNPAITIDELISIVPGPDFPTGAQMFAGQGLRDAYATGKGKIVIRAVAEVEERKGGFRIVVTEVPYQTNKADLVARIADLVKEKRIDGISDIRDESNREGVRVVIELRANSYPKKVLNKLYELTSLQTAFHFNMLALVNEVEPQLLSLRDALDQFIWHRQKVVRRRAEYELKKARERAHVLEGLITALDNIDEVVSIIRKSKDRQTAHAALMVRFALSEIQATAILDMRLSTLVGLERQRLADELKALQDRIAYLLELLGDEAKILAVIREETLAVKAAFPQPRRTAIIKGDVDNFSVEDLIPNEDVVIALTRTGYVKRMSKDSYRTQTRGGKGVSGITTKDEDEVAFFMAAKTHDVVYFFTDKGKLYRTFVYELPQGSRQSKGQAIVNVIQVTSDEKVTALLCLTKEEEQKAGYFIMGTTDGTVKKTEISAYANVRKNGIIAINLAPGNTLRWAKASSGKDKVFMATEKAQAILFPEEEIRATGRSAAGVRGMKLRPEDRIVGMSVLTDEAITRDDVLVVLENGYGKRTPMKEFDVQHRGGMGIKLAAVTAKVGRVVEVVVTEGDDGALMIISTKGTVIKSKLSTVKRLGRVTQGVTLMRLSGEERVASATVVPDEVEGEE